MRGFGDKPDDACAEKNETKAQLELEHLAARDRSERDFFQLPVGYTLDQSNPGSIRKNEINQTERIAEIVDLAPDLVVACGCSIIRGRLFEDFKKRFLNVHLGLSPFYRGSGANFWPFVNDEPEFAGLTFMYLDAGIDTGEIIHQVRPRIYANDDIPSIGNRIIADMARDYGK